MKRIKIVSTNSIVDIPSEFVKTIGDLKIALSEYVPLLQQKLVCKGKVYNSDCDHEIISDNQTHFVLFKIETVSANVQCIGEGCAFWGNRDKKGYCSKCFAKLPYNQKVIMPYDSEDIANANDIVNDTKVTLQTDKEICWHCKTRVGLLGFKCSCEFVYCAKHRLAEDHNCAFNYKEAHQQRLRKLNSYKITKLKHF